MKNRRGKSSVGEKDISKIHNSVVLVLRTSEYLLETEIKNDDRKI